jgi:hypothetical protein
MCSFRIHTNKMSEKLGEDSRAIVIRKLDFSYRSGEKQYNQ